MAGTSDHLRLVEAAAVRRYFAKFERIIGHLQEVSALTRDNSGPLAKVQIDIAAEYLASLANTFTALSYKHLMAQGVADMAPQRLEIDRRESGFPLAQELMRMANDLAQTRQHLDTVPGRDVLKSEMVDHILVEREPPRRLQFAMSQRVYFELLEQKPMFLPQNHPEVVWLQDSGQRRGRKHFLIHWAVYDTQENLPAIYLMLVEDSGEVALPEDDQRWPAVQNHLMAQAITSLKLLTIARGFDKDFEDLHPQLLRRIHVGPMYSHAFTQQTGALRDVLAEAAGEPGLDWALSWTTETLVSSKSEQVQSGVFGRVERQIYEIDYYGRSETGASRIDRSLVMPPRPYHVLALRDPPELRKVRKYVVGEGGAVLVGP